MSTHEREDETKKRLSFTTTKIATRKVLKKEKDRKVELNFKVMRESFSFKDEIDFFSTSGSGVSRVSSYILSLWISVEFAKKRETRFWAIFVNDDERFGRDVYEREEYTNSGLCLLSYCSFMLYSHTVPHTVVSYPLQQKFWMKVLFSKSVLKLFSNVDCILREEER